MLISFYGEYSSVVFNTNDVSVIYGSEKDADNVYVYMKNGEKMVIKLFGDDEISYVPSDFVYLYSLAIKELDGKIDFYEIDMAKNSFKYIVNDITKIKNNSKPKESKNSIIEGYKNLMIADAFSKLNKTGEQNVKTN